MVKTTLILWAMLFFGSTASFAQSNGYYIGIEGGPNRTSIWGNDYIRNSEDLSKAPNFLTGVSFEYSFTHRTSLRSGLAIERKGVIYDAPFKDEFSNIIGSVPGRSYFDYLTLPLMARVTFGKKPQFFINAGPYLAYILSQKDVIYDSELMPGITVDNSKAYKKVDIGISAGLGTGVSITEKTILTLELRHNLGLYNIYNVPTFYNGVVKTNSTNLLLGIAYKLKG